MKKTLTILAIESSCDETAAAVIKNDKIASSIIASQADLHAKYGGVVPEVAAREHVPTIIPTIDLALKEGRTKLKDLDVIAVTKGPGLATSLHVGIDAAKSLALALNIPLLPVNHMEAHIYANFTEPETHPRLDRGSRELDPRLRGDSTVFPALIMIVSGGHTMLVHMKAHGKYKILGETMDDAAGEAFDKTAKLLGLGYPGGPQISKLGENGNPLAYNFPRPMLNSPDLNFSFSGLKTAVLYQVQKMHQIGIKEKQDLAASVQAAIVETLIGKLEQAVRKYKPKSLMLGGGVGANKLFREKFIALADQLGLDYSVPPLMYCTDNAAMIGLAAYYRIKNKKARYSDKFGAEPNLGLK